MVPNVEAMSGQAARLWKKGTRSVRSRWTTEVCVIRLSRNQTDEKSLAAASDALLALNAYLQKDTRRSDGGTHAGRAHAQRTAGAPAFGSP